MADNNGANQTQWLMRKAPVLGVGGKYTITPLMGPYLTSQIRSMIDQGMLDHDDEVCPENGYWFMLSDMAEVRKQLGVEPPSSRTAGNEEVTQPDLTEEKTAPELILEGSEPADPESTGMIKVSRPAQSAPKPKAPMVVQPNAAATIGMQYSRVKLSAAYGFAAPPNQKQGPIRVEKSKFWVILLASACLLALIGVLWAIRTLHQAE